VVLIIKKSGLEIIKNRSGILVDLIASFKDEWLKTWVLSLLVRTLQHGNAKMQQQFSKKPHFDRCVAGMQQSFESLTYDR